MGIAERLALCVIGDDLGWSDARSKPIELVAALSGTSNLGSDLHRAKDHDLSAMRRAVLLLAHKALTQGKRKRLYLSQAQAQAMAVAALFEMTAPQCRTCNGAAVVIVDKLKVECDTCGGIGVHRYSDRERAKLCGIHHGDWHRWARRYRMVIDIARGNDTAQSDASARWG